jgi:hypothetical protein
MIGAVAAMNGRRKMFCFSCSRLFSAAHGERELTAGRAFCGGFLAKGVTGRQESSP